ncbi:uncharacterized protein LOC112679324 [Sipha flava]|uniref:Uncharacterized protein LOC112679324 n=1 Tax=Sipha flava TaxID=143950 RepID=A0A8B8F265_9HEMI|nr:uncharacterized protein LOC112679324 [Sipha flava]
MRILPFVFLLLMGMTWRCVQSTCVLETDFGLSINCGLKKTGMFRVRNLGGFKGYVGLGIQLADELGFKESLSSLEQSNKRRSVNGFLAPGSFEPLAVPHNNDNQATTSATNNLLDRSAYAKMNGRTVTGKSVTVPPFRPLVAATNNMVRNVRLATQQQQQQLPLKPLPVPAFAALPESIAKIAVETPKPQQPLAAGHRQPQSPAHMQPMTTSAFATLRQPVAIVQPQIPQPQLVQVVQVPQNIQLHHGQNQQQKLVQLVQLPQNFQPQQQIVQQPKLSPVYHHNAMQQVANRRYNAFASSQQNASDVRPIIVLPTPTADNRKLRPENAVLTNDVDPGSMMSLFNVAAANNVSVEQLAMALRHRQQWPSFYSASTDTQPATTTTATTSTTSTTTTAAPPPPTTTTTAVYDMPDEPPATKKIAIKPYRYGHASGHKVMNAPNEYYPVGYDKNFDDHFVSKVDLPDTSFSCGEQKHFPGLYGDEDLGCMVFHVCAFTDDGLTQKSFLCPESTLFDQTILKCNWWFYVDCKSSRKLYDSNIPISKSYQLMKALTFFSSYAGGPTVDASVAAATAAVSTAYDHDERSPDKSADGGSPDKSADGRSPNKSADEGSPGQKSSTTAVPTAEFLPASSSAASSTEILDNVSFRRR